MYLADKMDRVPERPPADGSGVFRTEIVAGLQRVDGKTDGLAEAVSRGIAFHHAGEAHISAADHRLSAQQVALAAAFAAGELRFL